MPLIAFEAERNTPPELIHRLDLVVVIIAGVLILDVVITRFRNNNRRR